jgi:hypothetical protein
MTARATLLALALATAPLGLARAQAPAAPTPCTPDGKVGYVCGLRSVEDMVAVPGGRWIVGTALQAGAGGLYIIDAKARTAKVADITFGPAQAPFADCTAPDPKTLNTHGLEIRPGKDGVHTVYVVNHGGRESLEVFHLDARGTEPKVTWIGCLKMPANASGNAVVALPGGSLALTKFADADDKDSIVHILGGAITGVVYIWTPGRGFKELAGTKLSGDNGMVATPDGKWLFVTDYGRKAVYRVPLDGSGKVTSVAVDFHPDNLRWAPDGKVVATGQYITLENRAGLHGWSAVKIDPKTMAQTPFVKLAGTAAFDNGTTTLQVGQDLWIGTYRGDRVAYLPAP